MASVEISERTIKEKLQDLNLTTDPVERRKKHEWFVKQKIPLFFHNEWAVLLPQGVVGGEIHNRLERMNVLRDELTEQAQWFKNHGLTVTYYKVDIDGKKVGYHTVR